eukprot:scaffold39585_cov39-Phaeocystis_antarctica.AAC.1
MAGELGAAAGTCAAAQDEHCDAATAAAATAAAAAAAAVEAAREVQAVRALIEASAAPEGPSPSHVVDTSGCGEVAETEGPSGVGASALEEPTEAAASEAQPEAAAAGAVAGVEAAAEARAGDGDGDGDGAWVGEL